MGVGIDLRCTGLACACVAVTLLSAEHNDIFQSLLVAKTELVNAFPMLSIRAMFMTRLLRFLFQKMTRFRYVLL